MQYYNTGKLIRLLRVIGMRRRRHGSPLKLLDYISSERAWGCPCCNPCCFCWRFGRCWCGWCSGCWGRQSLQQGDQQMCSSCSASERCVTPECTVCYLQPCACTSSPQRGLLPALALTCRCRGAAGVLLQRPAPGLLWTGGADGGECLRLPHLAGGPGAGLPPRWVRRGERVVDPGCLACSISSTLSLPTHQKHQSLPHTATAPSCLPGAGMLAAGCGGCGAGIGACVCLV